MILIIEDIKNLETRNNQARGAYILDSLKKMGVEPSVQEIRLPKIKNIIVDFSRGLKRNTLLFSAHYDTVRNSPGANDNASGVAVLLSLCNELKNAPFPVRVAFFDREEAWLRTPLLNLGLLGSLVYVISHNLKDIAAVYNLEFCGLGDYLGIWPIKGPDASLEAFRLATAAARQLKIPSKSTHIPWIFLSSDHFPFRLKGVPNSLTLSLLPSDQVVVLEKLLTRLSLYDVLIRRRKILPEPLSMMHSPEDNSSHLSEDALNLMLTLLKEIIRQYGFTETSKIC